MIENLFDKPTGYLVIIGVALTIYCTFLNFKKERKPRGYIKLDEKYQKSAMYLCTLISFFITMFFFIANLLGIKDRTDGTLEYHVILGFLLVFASVCAFLYYNSKIIIFNEVEINVYNFFGKHKVYYWNDILEVKNKKNMKLIIKTTNGKFKVDFYLENINKFLKIIYDKKITNEDMSMFGVNKRIIGDL